MLVPTFLRHHVFILVAYTCVEASSFTTSAQEPHDNTLKTMRTSLRERIIQDLKAWDVITDHRTGTAGDNATANWLANEIRATGLKPLVDRFEFKRWVLKECSVILDGTRIAGVPLFDGGVTGPNPIRAKLGRPGEAGTIALTRFTPFRNQESTQSMMAARQKSEHLAVIAVAAADAIAPGANAVAPGLALINAEAYAKPYGLSVLQVGTEHGKKLDEALSSGEQVEFRAHVVTENTSACNVQVTIRGKQPDLSPLVIMTPRSGWWTCTSERGGGITVWLECIRYFAQHQPQRNVIFIANTGHELGHVGLNHYLRQKSCLVQEANAWIHLGASFAARNGKLLLQASSANHMKMLQDKLAAEGQTADWIMPLEDRAVGEARNIYDGKGQFVSILGDNPLFHHPDDRWPHAIDLPRTLALTRALLEVAKQLSGT